MTTLRDQITAKLHATWDLDSHDVEAFVAELLEMFRREETDATPASTTLRDQIEYIIRAIGYEPDGVTAATERILALLRDEAPPSDEDLSKVATDTAIAGLFDIHAGYARVVRALYDLGHARGIASGEAERHTLQTALESAQSDRQRAVDDLFAQAREREAERAELQRRSAGYERGLKISQQCLTDALTRARAAERERDAALSELRQGSMRLAVEACRTESERDDEECSELEEVIRQGTFSAVANWLEAEARKAGAKP